MILCVAAIGHFKFLLLTGVWVVFLTIFSVGDHVGENGGSNYSTQFKNLEKLVKSLETQVLTKLDGSSSVSSSSNPLR